MMYLLSFFFLYFFLWIIMVFEQLQSKGHTNHVLKVLFLIIHLHFIGLKRLVLHFFSVSLSSCTHQDLYLKFCLDLIHHLVKNDVNHHQKMLQVQPFINLLLQFLIITTFIWYGHMFILSSHYYNIKAFWLHLFQTVIVNRAIPYS